MVKEVTGGGIRLLRDDEAAAGGYFVAFSDRNGGVSLAPFDTLNLAARVGDDFGAVEVNRERAAQAAGFSPGSLALARQVHGTGVLEAGAGAGGVIGEADVLVTSAPGVVLGILSADCAPVLLAGDGAVAAVHAGWRGLAAGVVGAGVAALGRVRRAWVGPSIHACCYRVGPDVIEAFRGAGLPVAGLDRVDPGRAAMVALRHAGVEEIEMVTDCTSCDARYFSYRRDGLTGRQGAFVAVIE